MSDGAVNLTLEDDTAGTPEAMHEWTARLHDFDASAGERSRIRNETATFRWRSVQCQPHPAGTVVGGRSKPITSAQCAACSVNDPCPFAGRLST
jgi:hypothetical protein